MSVPEVLRVGVLYSCALLKDMLDDAEDVDPENDGLWFVMGMVYATARLVLSQLGFEVYTGEAYTVEEKHVHKVSVRVDIGEEEEYDIEYVIDYETNRIKEVNIYKYEEDAWIKVATIEF